MGEGEIEIRVYNAYFAPKKMCCKPKAPEGPSMPDVGAPDAPDMPDVPKPDMPDMPKVSMPDVPKPDMPDMPKGPDMPNAPNMPKGPKCPCKKPPPKDDTYTCTISTGGIAGVGATSYTSDEIVDKGNYISLRGFSKNFDISADEAKNKGDKTFRVQIHKKSGNPLIPAKEVCDVKYEPDCARWGGGEKVPLKSGGADSYVYCYHYMRRRPS